MDLPFISLDYGYFLNISASLGADEAGAWLMLYSQAWGRGGSLQDDDDRLCRLCRLTKRKWMQIRPVVLSDWRSDSGQLFNDVLTKEYARALKNKSEKVKAGKARQNGKSQINQGNNASTAQAALNASPSPSPLVGISNDIPPPISPKPKEPKNERSKPKRFIPNDWQPDASCIKACAARGFSIDAERDAFVDYWISRGEARADWNAAFRNWMRTARGPAVAGNNPNKNTGGVGKNAPTSYERSIMAAYATVQRDEF